MDPETEQKKIVSGNLAEMSDSEVERAVEVILNRYIPNLVASFAEPIAIYAYRLRAIALLEECVVRQRRACGRMVGR